MRRLFLLIPLVGFSPCLSAENVGECIARLKDPVECYIVKTENELQMCGSSVELSMSRGEAFGYDKLPAKAQPPGPTWLSCKSKAEREAKPFYSAALRALSGNPSATSLLKDHYAHWQTGLWLLRDKSGETAKQDRRRIDGREETLFEKGNRLRLEK